MDRHPLGTTGLRVPRLGLGTVKIGRNRGVKYPDAFDLPSDARVRELLDAALACGAVLLDTAPAYGSAEARLRPWLAEHREEVVLCTKAGENFHDGLSSYDFRGESLERSLEGSLRRLGTDHVDVLLLHSDGSDARILEETDALESLRRMKEAGKVRAIGMSAKTAGGVRTTAERMDVVMAPYGAGQLGLEPELARAHAAGCGVLAIKVLGQGHALGPGESWSVATALERVYRGGFVDCAVLGTSNPHHLREAARAVERWEHPDPRENPDR